MAYRLVLKSLKVEGEFITLAEGVNPDYMEGMRKAWRKCLGGPRWTVDRRPGLDTLDHLGLKVEKV